MKKSRIILILSLLAIPTIVFFCFFGITKVKLGDSSKIVLFLKNANFKMSDIVIVQNPLTNGKTTGRIAGTPSSSVLINDGVLYINGKKVENDSVKLPYRINCFTDSAQVSLLKKYPHLQKNDLRVYYLCLTDSQYNKLKKDSIYMIKKDLIPLGFGQTDIFPHSYNFNWNKDNFGTLKIPKKNYKIDLNKSTYSLYRTTIQNFEKKEIKKQKNGFFIANKKVETYIFKQNYFFILNDNRLNTSDSRKWGPIPESLIRGKLIMTL